MSCLDVTAPMAGKTCVITGANTGIGKEAAKSLARLGAKVVMVCRDPVKGDAALAEIARAGWDGGRGGTAELQLADLSSQAEVRRLAETLLSEHPVIDVLVNNAGMAPKRRELTADGIERTFAVNFLAYYMLANLLLPALRAARSARIVNVASGAHAAIKRLDFDNLQSEKRFRGYLAYSMSKLEDIMLTYAMSRQLDGSAITVNSLHPGVIATEIWRESPVIRFIGKFFMSSPERGSQTTVYAAASPDLAGVTGQYFDKCVPARTTAMARDEAAQKRLMEIAERLTGVGAG